MTKGNCSLKIIKLTQQAWAHAAPPKQHSSPLVAGSPATNCGRITGGSRCPLKPNAAPLKPNADCAPAVAEGVGS